MNTTTAANNGNKPAGSDGIDPEELPLFREFEAFVSAIYTEAAKATSRELDAEVARFARTIAEKHTQHTRIADEVAAKLPRIAEEFASVAAKHGAAQQAALEQAAGALQRSADHFNRTIEHDLSLKAIQISRAVDQSTARLRGEADQVAKVVKDSRESYFHLFEPFAEDLHERNRVLLDEHLRQLHSLQDDLASWPRVLEARLERAEEGIRQEISDGRNEVAAGARREEEAASRQQEEAAGFRRILTALLAICTVSLLVSAGTLLSLLLRH